MVRFMPALKNRLSPDLLLPIASSALVLLYLLTLSRVHGWDAMAYAARAASDPFLSERYLSTRLFHPHHLLYVPLAMLARLPFRIFTDEPFLPLQFLNAVLGAGSGFLAGLLARRMGARPLVAAGAALGAGLSSALWRYATEVEVMVPCLFCLLLATTLLDRARSQRHLFVSGLVLSAAVLLHQIAVLYAAAGSAILFLRDAREDRRQAARAATAFTLGWALPTITAYLAVGLFTIRPQAVTDLVDWMLAVRSRSTFTSRSSGTAFIEAGRSMVSAWVTLAPFSGAPEVPGRFLPAVQMAAGTALIGGTWLLLRSLPGVVRALKASCLPARLLIAGGGAMALFIAWFQPWNPDYWVYFPPMACALAGAYLPKDAPRLKRIAFLTFPALLLANLFGQALPLRDLGRAGYAEVLEFARQHLHRGDLLLSGGVDSAVGDGIVALPLLAGIAVIPVSDAPPADMSAEGTDPFEREIEERARASWANDGRVFTLGEGLAIVESLWSPAEQRLVATFRGESLVEIRLASRP